MPYKDPRDPRYLAARRRHYENNKEPYLARAREAKRQIQDLVREAKNKPCMDCGETFPYYVMDLDHRDPAAKLFDPAALSRRGSIRQAKEEIAKCDAVCANCHRTRTYNQKLVPGSG